MEFPHTTGFEVYPGWFIAKFYAWIFPEEIVRMVRQAFQASLIVIQAEGFV